MDWARAVSEVNRSSILATLKVEPIFIVGLEVGCEWEESKDYVFTFCQMNSRNLHLIALISISLTTSEVSIFSHADWLFVLFS